MSDIPENGHPPQRICPDCGEPTSLSASMHDSMCPGGAGGFYAETAEDKKAPPSPPTEDSGGLSMGGGDGILQAVVWPTHAGAVNDRGEEPMGDPDYDRGQITWALNEQGRLVGHARVNVPAGTWDWTIYTHHPTTPGFIIAHKFAHPMVFDRAAYIDLIDITDEDIGIMAPDKALHD